MGLNSQVGGQEAGLAVAAEDTELQVQVHLRTHGVASYSGTRGNACILKAVTYCSAEKTYCRQGKACDRQEAHMDCTKSRRSVAYIEELFAGVLTCVGFMKAWVRSVNRCLTFCKKQKSPHAARCLKIFSESGCKLVTCVGWITWAVSPEGVVHAMGEVVRNVLLANVNSVTGLPSSSTTACARHC